MEPKAPAQMDQGKLAQLMSMFGIGQAPQENSEAVPSLPANGAKDTAADSGVPAQPGMPPAQAPQGGEGGLLGALKNLMQFFDAKAGSASNDSRYQKALTDAGIPADQTGIGH
jgi:hypothetical protein